jgi:hypothetical protein
MPEYPFREIAQALSARSLRKYIAKSSTNRLLKNFVDEAGARIFRYKSRIFWQ